MPKAMLLSLRYAVLSALFLLPSYAALMTYTNPTLFSAAAPGLPTETFEAGLVSPGGRTVCAAPVNSTTSNACFLAGSWLPGVAYSVTSGSLAVYGNGYDSFANNSKVFGATEAGSTLNLTFNQANAVSFLGYPGFLPANLIESVFSTNQTLLGTFSSGSYFAVVSDTDLIGQITLSNHTPFPPVLDNLSFGLTTTMPEPSTWLLAMVGLMAIYKRKRLAFPNTSLATAERRKGAGPA